MIEVINQIIKYYLQYKKSPTVNDLQIEDITLMDPQQKSLFITLYKNGEIRWASWTAMNLNKIPLITLLIENTVYALSKDNRFDSVELKEIQDLKIRLDIIQSKTVLSEWKTLKSIDPTKSWILAIKKDYEKIALILSNIHPVLITWDDYNDVLKAKLDDKEFKEENYLLYEIITEQKNNFA